MATKSAKKTKALLSWSSGKDSAYALYKVLQAGQWEVVSLVTTVTDPFQRVSMHGVRETLLDAQSRELGIPLHKIRIPSPCPNSVYEEKMSQCLNFWKEKGIRHLIFGDLFLEDVRSYREKNLAKLDMEGVFPLWHQETSALAKNMIDGGFKAVITCIDLKKLAPDFGGRQFDFDFLARLPKECDPCGENGEFHSFVFSGPIFKKEIAIKISETVVREGFQFSDVLPI